MVFLFLFNMVGHSKRSAYIFVSYVDICADTLPWARGRPRPWMFFSSSILSSSFAITIFYILPKAGILQFFSLLFFVLLCSKPNHYQTALGGQRHRFSYVSLLEQTFLVSPMFLSKTSRLQFKHSQLEDSFRLIWILHIQTNCSSVLCALCDIYSNGG